MEQDTVTSQNVNTLQDIFSRPFFLSATIGIPFCIFKLLFGVTAVRVAPGTALDLFGWAVILWAGADLVMNTGRAIFDIIGMEAPFEYCTIAQFGRLFKRPMVFLAFDTLLTFCIISAMLWSGWITILTRLESVLWYAATTLNLISLSLVILYNEIRRSE